MCKDLQALDTLLVDGTVLMNSGVAKTVVAISTNTQLADITDTDPGECSSVLFLINFFIISFFLLR